VTQDTQLFLGHDPREPAVREPDGDRRGVPRRAAQAACDSLLARPDRGLDTVIGEGRRQGVGRREAAALDRPALLRHRTCSSSTKATSSLDSLTEEEIGETIRDVAARQDVITILIAHRLSTIMHADRSTSSNAAASSRPARTRLLDQKGLYYAMWAAADWRTARGAGCTNAGTRASVALEPVARSP
jgi:ATP-binding cassette subfamily B protein